MGSLLEPSDRMRAAVCTIAGTLPASLAAICRSLAEFRAAEEPRREFRESPSSKGCQATHRSCQMKRSAQSIMMPVLRTKAVVHESCPEGALVYRKPSRRRADARRDRGDRRRLALSHGAGVRRGDRVVGHALCACPASQRGGARAGQRRTRYPQPRAGGGLRLARSIHPRVSRPFRGHARSGPRARRVSTISNFRSRS